MSEHPQKEITANSSSSVSEMAENLEESTVTMVEVLQQQEFEEESAAAVLGGSDGKNCTYEKGYIKRQALYSCLTCCPEARTDATKAIGVCLACSYQCHENHDMVELYTKRNFRCDCPTERRTTGGKCIFVENANASNRLPINPENAYNQNFSGIYCTCKRPYPDPEDSVQDEMVQCVMCEDWHHLRHLNTNVPDADSYADMVCGDCMEKFSFLKDYAGLTVNKVEPRDEQGDISATSTDDEKLKSELEKSISVIMNSTKDTSAESDDDDDEPAAKKLKLDELKCRRPVLGNGYKKGGVFLPENWRAALCNCCKCSKIYEDTKCTWLFDPEDTVLFYEENGLKQTTETFYERGIKALSTLDPVAQIEVITGYNDLKDKLKEFLNNFLVQQKVVTEADVKEFFQKLKNQKNNFGQPSHFCR